LKCQDFLRNDWNREKSNFYEKIRIRGFYEKFKKIIKNLPSGDFLVKFSKKIWKKVKNAIIGLI